MNAVKAKRYAAALQVKQAELATGLENRSGLETAPQADPLDEIQSAMDRALVVQTLDRSSSLFRQVRAALGRIADGTYGECLHCDEEIRPRRLDAVPWTSLCLACQERIEAEGAGSQSSLDGEEAA